MTPIRQETTISDLRLRFTGRNIGQDFEGKDGWRMYHGDVVPGFPQHPHRGFETVTIMRHGFVDHSDSLGATARFGPGDVQWLTAGKGIVHSEMFPLLRPDGPNPLELFQIWLNLPGADKFVRAALRDVMGPAVPRITVHDSEERATQIVIVAGHLGNVERPATTAQIVGRTTRQRRGHLDRKNGPRRALYSSACASHDRAAPFISSAATSCVSRSMRVPRNSRVVLRPEAEVTLHNGNEEGEFLLLQGRPINEPVVQYGPFVMNSCSDIQQAFDDYRPYRFRRLALAQ